MEAKNAKTKTTSIATLKPFRFDPLGLHIVGVSLASRTLCNPKLKVKTPCDVEGGENFVYINAIIGEPAGGGEREKERSN